MLRPAYSIATARLVLRPFAVTDFDDLYAIRSSADVNRYLVFHPDQQGRGFATEAADAVLRLGFTGLGLHRIIGCLDYRNIASARVMEKLGMRQEAHFVHDEIFKGEWSDQLVYAILDDEWTARRRDAPQA